MENAIKRNIEIDDIIRKLYEDNIKGKISDERFDIMSKSYEVEQSELQSWISSLREIISKEKDEMDLQTQFIRMVMEYTEIPELTSEILHNLIDKIYVYQSERIKGRIRSQAIKIVYNFVGAVSIPNESDKREIVWGSNEQNMSVVV